MELRLRLVAETNISNVGIPNLGTYPSTFTVNPKKHLNGRQDGGGDNSLLT
jgi:hypothetical protein